jgi:hypothetical protein
VGGGVGVRVRVRVRVQLGAGGTKGALERGDRVCEDGRRLGELVLLEETQGERGEVPRHAGEQHARLG